MSADKNTRLQKKSYNSDFAERFYEKYSRYVYKRVWQECHIPADVDDIVQSTWEALSAKWSTLEKLSDYKQLSYISVTITNIIRMNARKKKLETCSLESIAELGYNGAIIMDMLLDRKTQIKHFHEAWANVDPSTRELLERKYILEQTDAEIAASMQIKASSVRTYLTRARRAALTVLKQHGHIDHII